MFGSGYLGFQTEQKCPKSECFCLDFRHCLKSELFDNRTIIDEPKSERVRILALYCTKDVQTQSIKKGCNYPLLKTNLILTSFGLFQCTIYNKGRSLIGSKGIKSELVWVSDTQLLFGFQKVQFSDTFCHNLSEV